MTETGEKQDRGLTGEEMALPVEVTVYHLMWFRMVLEHLIEDRKMNFADLVTAINVFQDADRRAGEVIEKHRNGEGEKK